MKEGEKMAFLLGLFSSVFQWAGALRGLVTFIVPVWGFLRGRFNKGTAVAAR